MNNSIAQRDRPAIDFHIVAAHAAKPDAGLFNLLCHPVFNPPASPAETAGGADNLRNAVNQLQSLLYAA